MRLDRSHSTFAIWGRSLLLDLGLSGSVNLRLRGGFFPRRVWLGFVGSVG